MHRPRLRFPYNPVKAAQAAAQLIILGGGKMDTWVLIKLLYLADRAALMESGQSVTNDRMVSLPHGPVLSGILDHVNWNERPWRDYISERTHHILSLEHAHPDDGELSEYDGHILARVFKEYGHLDRTELRTLTHSLPEYEDPDGSSLPIDPADILRFAGKSDAEIEDIIRDAERHYIAHQTLQRQLQRA